MEEFHVRSYVPSYGNVSVGENWIGCRSPSMDKDLHSDLETQFIPQEDDDQTLWEVIEITAERGKTYKVRWKGNDPKTHRPWPQSWVPKHDCTNDLVQDWKLKQAKKKKKDRSASGTAAAPTTTISTEAARSKTKPGANKRKRTPSPTYPSTVSKQHWEELNDFQSQQVTEPEMMPGRDQRKTGYSDEGPDLDRNRDDGADVEDSLQSQQVAEPDMVPTHDQRETGKSEDPDLDRNRDGEANGEDGLLPRRVTEQGIVPGHDQKETGDSQDEPNLDGNKDGDADAEDVHRLPILSPDAMKRLKQFDGAIMKIELKSGKGKGKGHGAMEVDGIAPATDCQTEDVENPHHLGAAMRLLNTKSEEISKLEGELSAAQAANEDLLQQLSALRLHFTEFTNDTQSATKTLGQELADARAELALKTASWENERVALTLNVETTTRNQVSAEQDRDFFREQYVKASAFVSSVRAENAELEKQIKIATDQAQSGVSLIKTTFELRTKSLEEDVRAWRRMAEFLIEKDCRTNDDVRHRAAEEPELRARCDRQEGELEETSERLEQLEMELVEQQRMYVEAEETGKRWKEATMKLNLELNEAKTKLERIGKVGIGDGDENAHSNGHEFVYRCLWRPDESNDICEAVFLNISELQEHLYTGGHLQPD